MAGHARENPPHRTGHSRTARPFPPDLVRLRHPFAARHTRAFSV